MFGTRAIGRMLALGVMAFAAAATARANVGEPTGAGPGNTFSIRVTQGGTVIVDNPAVTFPSNIKTIPLEAIQVGTIGGYPIALRIQSDFSGLESFRITHWYLMTPISMAAVDTPGPISLIDPTNADPIKVEIGNIRFTNNVFAYPLVVNNNSFAVSHMIDSNGRFYQTPNTNSYNAYGQGKVDVQVSGEWYSDGNLAQYVFASTPGTTVSWVWDKIIPPMTTTQVVDNNGNFAGTGLPSAGHVYQLGLGVAFTPEPATLLLLAGGGFLLLGSRRYRYKA